MGRPLLLLILSAALALLPASSALASSPGGGSGGSGLVPPTAPTGIVHTGTTTTTGTTTKVFSRTLRKGARGSDVKTLQTWLTDLGYGIPVTGYFGTMTQKAVKSFQSVHDLHPVTGTVGRITAGTLLTLVQASATAGPSNGRSIREWTSGWSPTAAARARSRWR
jgi:peptidoglycan hydrolase-like protein with peptidoglycan-binding domain